MTFDERIQKAIAETKSECQHNPNHFVQIIERIIFEPEWHDMFSKEELTEARKRLKDLNYDVSELSVEPLKKDNLEGTDIIFNLSDQYFLDAITYGNILHESDKSLLRCFLNETDHTRSASQLAEELGYHDIGPVNALVGKLAKRIVGFYDVSLEREGNSPGWWRVIADGEYVDGTFFWTLKPAFVKALKDSHRLEPPDIPADHWSLVGGDEEELKEQAEKESKSLSDSELYGKASQQGTAKPKEKATTTYTYARNTYVAEASKRRAKGICQLCGNPAPFNDRSGNPYLESHHIIWLSEGGADVLDNTVALCPNCHKKMHVVNDPNDVKKLQDLNKLWHLLSSS